MRLPAHVESKYLLWMFVFACAGIIFFFFFHRWPTAVAMLASGKIDVKPMITHNFTLEETLKAFEMAKSGAGVKVIIDCEKKE